MFQKVTKVQNFRATRRFSNQVNRANKTVGWIGTGVMGRWMCEHLINGGYTNCVVYNRTTSKLNPLIAKGAFVADSPFEVGRRSDVVFTILGYPSDVRSVILNNGVLAGFNASDKKGKVIVDMTTSEPSLAKEIYEEAKKGGNNAIDAPVSGGDIGAKEARLSIMIGGDEPVVNELRPLFELMGKNIRYMGSAGSGQHTKMVNQILISTTMIGVVEGLFYAYKAGLDLNEVIAAVSAGAAGSWSISNYGPRIINRNFDPGFYVDHFVKDMSIALHESQKMKLNLPGLDLALRLYKELQALGHGKLGTHSLILAFEHMNDFKFNNK